LPQARYIKSKTIQPYYIIFGDNELFKEEFVNELLEVFLEGKVDPSASHMIDASDKEADVTASVIIEKASTPSFFSERTFVVVKEFTKLIKDEFEKLMAFLNDIPPNCNMVLMSSADFKDIDKKVLTPYAIPSASVFNFSSGRASEIIKWAKDYTAKAGKSVEDEVLEYIIEQSNSDAASVKNELDKLILVSGERREIGRDDFAKVKGVDKDYDVWALTAAVGAADAKKAFFVLYRIYDDMGPEAILGAVFNEIKKIYAVRYYMSVNAEAKALRYVYNNPRALAAVKQNVANYRKLSYAEALNIIREADMRIKTSARENALTALVIMIEKLMIAAGKK